jgi:transglutaminase-like putative cysteine protease
MMRHFFALVWLCGLCAGELCADGPLDPNQSYTATKANPVTYTVDFSAVVTPPYQCKVLKVWMPIPPSDEAQAVSGSELSSFPMKVSPKIGAEKLYGNKFAYFEFHEPQGAQIVRHRFTIKTWELRWNLDFNKVRDVASWPNAFQPFLRGERLVPVNQRFALVAKSIVRERQNAALNMTAVMDWVQNTLQYSHEDASLQGSAVHALEKKKGHCSDFHGLCTALGRNLGYPARIVYGINPIPRQSPSHCKLEVFLPPYGWVCFDVSETQQMIQRIQADDQLDAAQKGELTRRARNRLVGGFRDNTWFLQTKGSEYELEPPAKRRAAVVRTIYAEADGEALPEPDPADPRQRAFSWMTVHQYTADREVIHPFKDYRSLGK